MVPLSNLIAALSVVRNGVPKMKGLFSFSLISKITKSTGPFVGFIVLSSVSSAWSIFLSYPLIGDRVYILGDGEFRFFHYQYFLMGFAGHEFLEKSEHFSYSVVDLLALKDKGFSWVARYRCQGEGWTWMRGIACLDRLDEFFHVIPALMVIESEVLNDFLRFIGILIVEFAAGGAVDLALKMKGDCSFNF
ncbi:hypothetical protein Tco_0065475 [Tanacetum coccineum]